jgi:hypothetical protein
MNSYYQQPIPQLQGRIELDLSPLLMGQNYSEELWYLMNLLITHDLPQEFKTVKVFIIGTPVKKNMCNPKSY